MLFYMILTLIVGCILLIIFVNGIKYIVLQTVFCLIMVVGIVVLCNKYEKDPIYQQSISYPIRLKEANRKREVVTYKITLDINSLFFSNSFYVTKEEYDLLKEGDEIPFIYNTQTKTKEFDEKKFNQLIEKLKLKKENSQ